MSEAIITILLSIIIVFIVILIDTKSDVKMYKDLYDTSNYINKEVYQQLKNQSLEANILMPEILDALKYARKCAHPDNGGNNKDFMKYNKIYEDFLRKANLN